MIIMKIFKSIYTKTIHKRRTSYLAEKLSKFIKEGSSVLDIGCGDGLISKLIIEKKPSLNIKGLEISARPVCEIEYEVFDGAKIPLPDNSVDICLFTDVFHHSDNIDVMFKESCRVSKKYILIKDHFAENKLDFFLLKIMDWVGNKPHGVRLLYNYLNKKQWYNYFKRYELKVSEIKDKVNLYPFPINVIFGNRLHFIALLEKVSES